MFFQRLQSILKVDPDQGLALVVVVGEEWGGGIFWVTSQEVRSRGSLREGGLHSGFIIEVHNEVSSNSNIT